MVRGACSAQLPLSSCHVFTRSRSKQCLWTGAEGMQQACAGERKVDQPGEGLQVKPIPSSTVKEVFMKWVAEQSKADVPMAHDGMRNIFSPEVLLDEDKKWCTVEIPSGRKRPHIYQCAPQHLQSCRVHISGLMFSFLSCTRGVHRITRIGPLHMHVRVPGEGKQWVYDPAHVVHTCTQVLLCSSCELN